MFLIRKMEPLGRIELPTFPLPMGCYTPKPQWRRLVEIQFRFNHYGERFKITVEKQQTQNVIKCPRV